MTDQWKPVVGVEQRFEISDKGAIRNLRTGALVSHRKDKDGYLIASLWRGVEDGPLTIKVHREVAKAFIPNPDAKPQVNHKDGNRANPSLGNLEWVTVSENHLHSFRVLGRKISSERAVMAERDVNGVIERLVFESLCQARRAGFNRNGIYACINGEYQHHHGFKWSYLNV